MPKFRRGQILILVLLVVVVALAVGLSVASRSITNLRTSTQTEQSQRAFTAAEGGVEDILSRFNTLAIVADPGSPGTHSENVTVGDLTANVSVVRSNNYQSVIELGLVGQIDLTGITGNILVEWSSTSDAIEAADTASLEVVGIYGSAPSYSQQRWYFFGGASARPDESATADNPVAPEPIPNNAGCTPIGFQRCALISLANLSPTPSLLRLKPYWNKTTVRVSATGMKPQTYDISSTATTGQGITRKIQVSRTALKSLPAVFDFALFSEGSITK